MSQAPLPAPASIGPGSLRYSAALDTSTLTVEARPGNQTSIWFPMSTRLSSLVFWAGMVE